MKKSLALLLALVMRLAFWPAAACKQHHRTSMTAARKPLLLPKPRKPKNRRRVHRTEEPAAKSIETLKVAFVPSREPQEIITATEPLKELLKTELAKEGYDVGEVEITVGTTYEAVGEGLEAGTIDVGLIPGGTYVLYDDGARSS